MTRYQTLSHRIMWTNFVFRTCNIERGPIHSVSISGERLSVLLASDQHPGHLNPTAGAQESLVGGVV